MFHFCILGMHETSAWIMNYLIKYFVNCRSTKPHDPLATHSLLLTETINLNSIPLLITSNKGTYLSTTFKFTNGRGVTTRAVIQVLRQLYLLLVIVVFYFHYMLFIIICWSYGIILWMLVGYNNYMINMCLTIGHMWPLGKRLKSNKCNDTCNNLRFVSEMFMLWYEMECELGFAKKLTLKTSSTSNNGLVPYMAMHYSEGKRIYMRGNRNYINFKNYVGGW